MATTISKRSDHRHILPLTSTAASIRRRNCDPLHTRHSVNGCTVEPNDGNGKRLKQKEIHHAQFLHIVGVRHGVLCGRALNVGGPPAPSGALTSEGVASIDRPQMQSVSSNPPEAHINAAGRAGGTHDS
jgi:hypothetical protein